MSVQSVERAFAILDRLSRGSAGVSEIADSVGLAKSTVSRLLSTLQDLGAVDQSGAGSEYRVGSRIVDISAGAVPGRNLMAVARPHLVELVSLLGEAAGLSVLDGDQVYYVDQIDGDHPVSVKDWTGTRIPAHAVSSGLAMLAYADAERARVLAGPLEAFTPTTMTDPELLRRRLADVAACGSAWVWEEFSEGINSVAAPVFDADRMPIGAVHSHGPSYRFPGPDQADAIAAQVVLTAKLVTDRLAGRSRSSVA